MYRIRVTLPKRGAVCYKNLDIIHDALVNALSCAGAKSADITGFKARPWNFGALGWNRGSKNYVHTLVVSTPDPNLSGHMEHIKTSDISYVRASTSEAVSFSNAEISLDPDPIVPGQNALGILMLSPLAISRQDKTSGPRWHNSLKNLDLSAAVNNRLSRLSGRTVQLRAEVDNLYLRSNPRHDTLVQTKEFSKGRRSYVIGMRAPIVMQGDEKDLRLAWYTGIGEKTRLGFGCIGLVERGVGR